MNAPRFAPLVRCLALLLLLSAALASAMNAVVVLKGRLDSTNAADTEAKILSQIESGRPRIVVDAAGLDVGLRRGAVSAVSSMSTLTFGGGGDIAHRARLLVGEIETRVVHSQRFEQPLSQEHIE